MIPPFVLLVLWGLFILYGTTLPFDFSATGEQVWARWYSLLEHPWRRSSLPDIVSNVLLFVPWGVCVAACLARRGVGFGAALVCGGLSGFALSGFVEFLQLFAPSRTPSTSDLMTNTTGSIIGVLGGWFLIRWVWPSVEPLLDRLVARRPLAAIALALAAGYGLAGLSPYDVSIDVGDLRAAVKRVRPIPFGPPIRGAQPPAEPWEWTEELLSWVLYGGVLALALRESGRDGVPVVVGAAVLGGLLGGTIEMAQLVIRSRGTDATSVALAVAGATAGAFVVQAAGRRIAPRRWIGPALLLWGLAVALTNWTPPRFTLDIGPKLRWSLFVPFLNYYRRTDIYALSDLLNQVMAFIPLGLLLAVRDGRRPVWQATLAGFGVGFLLETGQLFLETRTADITDAFAAAAGAALGVALWRWGAAAWDMSRSSETR